MALDAKVRLFVDPASISTGWALFQGTRFISSGTVDVNANLDGWTRIYQLYMKYRNLKFPKFPEQVIFERMNPRVSYWVVRSVASIGLAMIDRGSEVDPNEEISPQSWQKRVEWRKLPKNRITWGQELQELTNTQVIESEDQCAAIGMGLYYTDRFLKEKE